MEDRGVGAMGPPVCDCGYSCVGATVEDRIRDALGHAREVHGIDVSREQVLASIEARSTATHSTQRQGSDER